MEPLALVAGEGSLPRLVCETAGKKGVPVAAVAFTGQTAKSLEGLADVKLLGLGEAEKVISHFRSKNCKRVCMIGKVEKKLVFQKLKFDLRALKLLGRVIKKDDSSIMREIMVEFENEGFEVVNQTDWLPFLKTGAGVLGKVQPTGGVSSDLEFGRSICRKMADMEIGQTIIVKDGVVLAVEAVEGTDAAIERGCSLGGGGAVMIKTARTNQDLRFDIPAVGLSTIGKLKDHGAAGLGFEADRVVVVDLPKVIKACDDGGIALVGL